MELASGIVLIVYVLLLIAAFCLVIFNFICDNHKCMAFNNAAASGKKGSKAYNEKLLSELFTDGIWPFAYIAATIASALSLWLIRDEYACIKKFTVLFLVIFLCIYLMLAFITHHYVEPIVDYLYNEIDFPTYHKIQCVQEEDLSVLFESLISETPNYFKN
jgi:hypothetical protein